MLWVTLYSPGMHKLYVLFLHFLRSKMKMMMTVTVVVIIVAAKTYRALSMHKAVLNTL